ncbi:hypothetical protein HK104_010295 [Borealophlyctis nickersoniae]|nr:hypothetical protein HK104_010295 [Borealophlyctis nickersoniae]
MAPPNMDAGEDREQGGHVQQFELPPPPNMFAGEGEHGGGQSEGLEGMVHFDAPAVGGPFEEATLQSETLVEGGDQASQHQEREQEVEVWEGGVEDASVADGKEEGLEPEAACADESTPVTTEDCTGDEDTIRNLEDIKAFFGGWVQAFGKCGVKSHRGFQARQAEQFLRERFEKAQGGQWQVLKFD